VAELTTRPLLARAGAGPYRPFVVRPRAFTVPQCRRIIDLGLGLPAERGGLVGGGGGDDGDVIRDSTAAWLPPGPDTAWIYQRLADVVDRANRAYGFELTAFEEDLQFTSYDRRGSHYTWHQDGLDAPVSHRKLSVVVQLSDPVDYRGADLEFLEVSEDYDRSARAAYLARVRARGTAVVFPSFEFHRVLPLRSGVRHSLVAWVGGPPFR
jgi:PKHD-type hydroxylase